MSFVIDEIAVRRILKRKGRWEYVYGYCIERRCLPNRSVPAPAISKLHLWHRVGGDASYVL